MGRNTLSIHSALAHARSRTMRLSRALTERFYHAQQVNIVLARPRFWPPLVRGPFRRVPYNTICVGTLFRYSPVKAEMFKISDL
jgi:hypothetical protein